MSVVTALSLVLVVGFLATGLVGFLGWRQRTREANGFKRIESRRRQPSTATDSQRETIRYSFEGACL